VTGHKRAFVVGVLAALIVTALAGCAPVTTEDTRLKVAMLPILDVLPIFIAEQNGYFAEQGIQVEQIPVKSAQERDVLIQTGQADGMLADLISTGLFNKDAARVKAVYTARRSFPEAPMFRVLAGPHTSIQAPADLRGVPIGLSQNTVIEYITDRMLAGEGLKPAEIGKIEVSAIPVRFEQLMNGNLKAATLPDPLGQGAVAGGAKVVVDDTKYADLSQSVLTFRTEALKGKPNTVRKFLAAWEKAVNELNAHPEKYQSLMIDKGRVPQSIQNSYRMPPFPSKGVPGQAEVEDVVQWLRDKGLSGRDIPYGDMVDGTFLPK